ncbi:MAG: hypothetical protein ACI85K_001309 [Hyphomicrobiaceae bacterium]|jgi:hypothetical protein
MSVLNIAGSRSILIAQHVRQDRDDLTAFGMPEKALQLRFRAVLSDAAQNPQLPLIGMRLRPHRRDASQCVVDIAGNAANDQQSGSNSRRSSMPFGAVQEDATLQLAQPNRILLQDLRWRRGAIDNGQRYVARMTTLLRTFGVFTCQVNDVVHFQIELAIK